MSYAFWMYFNPRSPRGRQIHRAIELGLPVPGTGKRSGGHMWRRPSHHSIHRFAEAFFIDDRMEDIRIRKARVKLPPTCWDHLIISANFNRNWKRHRRTQWR